MGQDGREPSRAVLPDYSRRQEAARTGSGGVPPRHASHRPRLESGTMTMGELWRRLQFLLHRERLREELEEEMRAHQARRAEMHQAGGMTPGDASAAARRGFGNAGLIQEA